MGGADMSGIAIKLNQDSVAGVIGVEQRRKMCLYLLAVVCLAPANNTSPSSTTIFSGGCIGHWLKVSNHYGALKFVG